MIGTGKRIGKTAVTGHVARLLSARMDVVVVSMGRGGPPEPEIVEVAPTLEALLEISRAGRHAASDYLETAALAGVPTIGCRRAGGGLAGQVFTSNVSRGAELVEEHGADLAVFDGSGAAIPPVAVNGRILVVGPGQDATAYLNAYRVLISDLVLLVGGGDPGPIRELKDVPVIGVDLRLRPVEPISGRRVAVFTTGPAPVDHLDADVVHVSRNLANRAALREELETDRRRGLPDRDQGGRDRRRRRGRGRAGSRDRVRRQRSPIPLGRAGPGRAASGPRRRDFATDCYKVGEGGRMSERRRTDPVPLGGDEPYSKGLMARALMRVGVSAVRAYEIARRVEQDLVARKEDTVTMDRVQELAVDVLGDGEGEKAVGRLRRYRELEELDTPIIILIGGATGTGKSTVATEVAYRLGITRVTSTDFVRQTLRAFFSPEFMPSIHYSSFEAGKGLRSVEEEQVDPLLHGFLDQTRNVLVGVNAAIERSLAEGWSTVLEGVHLVPGMTAPIEDALVAQCVLAIDSEDAHASHFWIRDIASDGARSLDKYLERLSDIRYLQDYIVERAEREGVPVIRNKDREGATSEVIELVLSAADRLQKV